MTTIVTRSGKGSPLTHAEMDSNLTNLNNNKAETNSPILTTPIFTGPQINTGDLLFSGTGQRIKGDFSGVVTSRPMFQSSTTNGNTEVEAIPNGTSTTAVLGVNNSQDPTNTSMAQLSVNAVASTLRSSQRGSGSFLPLVIETGGSESFRINADKSGALFSGNYAGNKQLTLANQDAGATSVATCSLASNSGTLNLYKYSIAGSGAAVVLSTGGVFALGTYDAQSLALRTNNLDRLTFGASGEYGIAGANYGVLGQTIISQGSGSPPVWGSPVMRSAAVPTTSGTSIDITSIPSTAKRITVMFNGVSTNGTSPMRVRLGSSSGGVESTGYVGIASSIHSGVNSGNITDGIGLYDNVATTVWAGILTIINTTGNTWVASGQMSNTTTASQQLYGSLKTLSSTLDRIRLTTVNGTDAFDAGAINILWE